MKNEESNNEMRMKNDRIYSLINNKSKYRRDKAEIETGILRQGLTSSPEF